MFRHSCPNCAAVGTWGTVFTIFEPVSLGSRTVIEYAPLPYGSLTA